MKMAILKTDALRSDLAARYGEYPAMFRALFAKLTPELQASAALDYVTYDVQLGEYPAAIDAADIYLITGSKSSSYDAEPWITALSVFIQKLHAAKKPLLGICFGHQIINQALGGTVAKAPQGWQVGVKRQRLLPAARDRGLALPNNRDHYALISSHQDQVQTAAPGFEVLAGSSECPIAMTACGEHILTVQGHPEFLPAYAAALYETRRAILSDALTDSATASLTDNVDADSLMLWALEQLTVEHA